MLGRNGTRDERRGNDVGTIQRDLEFEKTLQECLFHGAVFSTFFRLSDTVYSRGRYDPVLEPIPNKSHWFVVFRVFGPRFSSGNGSTSPARGSKCTYKTSQGPGECGEEVLWQA